jgi:hypothetical protein
MSSANEERGGLTPDVLARLRGDPGLCARCRHVRPVEAARSVFVRCGRSDDDPRFLRYPQLPVAVCPGFVAAG